jgi:hypothetical protein
MELGQGLCKVNKSESIISVDVETFLQSKIAFNKDSTLPWVFLCVLIFAGF